MKTSAEEEEGNKVECLGLEYFTTSQFTIFFPWATVFDPWNSGSCGDCSTSELPRLAKFQIWFRTNTAVSTSNFATKRQNFILQIIRKIAVIKNLL